MKTYTYSQARQNLSQVLNECKTEDVLIRRRGGELFRVSVEQPGGSGLNVGSIKTDATTEDILGAIRESRQRCR